MKKAKLITSALAVILSAVFMVLPASAALIGGDGGFYYSLNSDTATLEEFHGSSENIKIPDNVYGYKVTSIAENTFSNNKTIKSVVVPTSVDAIGAYAFYGCSQLESAVLPNSITEIGAATFYGCTALIEVTIPESVTKIAANAFTGCDKLTIKGDSGTYAETYAAEHGIKFEGAGNPIPEPHSDYYLLGDADLDGQVTSADALSVLRMSADLESCKDEDIPYFDVDKDNSITSADALELLRFSADLSTNERICKPLY